MEGSWGVLVGLRVKTVTEWENNLGIDGFGLQSLHKRFHIVTACKAGTRNLGVKAVLASVRQLPARTLAT